MKTLEELIQYLEHSTERAECDNCTALCLSVAEANALLPGLREAQAERIDKDGLDVLQRRAGLTS